MISMVSLDDKKFIKECIHIINKTKESDIIFRILGSIAVYIHSDHSERAFELYDKINRLENTSKTFTDLDVIAYSHQKKQVDNFLIKNMELKPNIVLNSLFGGQRSIYHHRKGNYFIDVFFDKLEFSHDIIFGSKPGHGRLELDYPTITLADLVLEKTQINRINRKDIVDLMILFMGHEVGISQEKESIDGEYISSVLSDDWGFWYDAVTNLNKVKEFADNMSSTKKIEKDDHDLIITRIDEILKMINETPKSKKWLKRDKSGTSKPWYREVEEIVR